MDLAGGPGERREEDRRARDHAAIFVEVVLRHPRIVEPKRLRQLDLLGQVAVEVGHRAICFGNIGVQVMHAEAHRSEPPLIWTQLRADRSVAALRGAIGLLGYGPSPYGVAA